MKSMINKMLKKAGLMVYNLFTRWKLDTFNDVERRRQLLRNRKLNAMMDTLDKTHRNHLKTALGKIDGDSMKTGMKRKIVNRLAFIGFGKLKNAFNDWKAHTFRKFAEERERKIAKVIDTLV